jgi:hypothetical protein
MDVVRFEDSIRARGVEQNEREARAVEPVNLPGHIDGKTPDVAPSV